MALLLRVVNESENVVVNQVVEEVNPSVEVGNNAMFNMMRDIKHDA